MKILKIRDVKTPSRGTTKSAGIDFFVPNDFPITTIWPQSDILIPSGIKVQVPKNKALIAFNKSGVATKMGLTIGACVIDEDYQGEIHLHLINASAFNVTIQPGDKIAQFILLDMDYDGVEEVYTLGQLFTEESERGEGGFGSTGHK